MCAVFTLEYVYAWQEEKRDSMNSVKKLVMLPNSNELKLKPFSSDRKHW